MPRFRPEFDSGAGLIRRQPPGARFQTPFQELQGNDRF
jgi:hypothetical protein